jgi:starch synthase
MKITFVGSEATPFAKTGGLADVLGSLPLYLLKKGHQVALILPKHQSIKKRYDDQLKTVFTTSLEGAQHENYMGIQHLKHQGLDVYFIDNEYYYGLRPHLYGDYDDGERYGFFAHAVLKTVLEVLPKTDILHLNDWQTGLVPYLLKYDPKYQSLTHIKTIFTIHNIAYQGRFAKDLMPYLNTDYSNLLEFDDVINFLKTGIMTADHVTTVSPTYKDQLQHAYFAYGMQGMLKLRSQSFTGILNGLDFNEFNPENDTALIKNYALKTATAGKKANKKDLMDAFGLKKPNLPLFGMVSRITEAKGFDLVADVIPPLVEKGLMNFVLLGSGDPYFEQTFQYFKDQYPEHFGVYFGYSDGMARQIYAGSDFFLMPSRFEPCGLAQMIAMRYGTLPVVHKTGGLKDTVEPFNEYTIEGTGFGFDTYQADDLKQAVLSAINVYGQSDIYKTLQKRAMQQDFSWESSASLYEELYQSLRG